MPEKQWILHGRRQPYTEIGVRRVPCTRCGEPAEYQWQVCADGRPDGRLLPAEGAPVNPAAAARKRDRPPKTAESEALRRLQAARRAAVKAWAFLDLKGARPRCAICGATIFKADVQDGSVQYTERRGHHSFACPACSKGGRP